MIDALPQVVKSLILPSLYERNLKAIELGSSDVTRLIDKQEISGCQSERRNSEDPHCEGSAEGTRDPQVRGVRQEPCPSRWQKGRDFLLGVQRLSHLLARRRTST